VTYDGDWRDTFRPDIPTPARIYDYLLGGKDNYPADRAVAEAMIVQLPNVRQAVQLNRAFLRRVVRYLTGEAGIRQIIDIGAGLPTAGNTHEVALDVCPRTLASFPPGSYVAIRPPRSRRSRRSSTRRRARGTSAPGPRSRVSSPG